MGELFAGGQVPGVTPDPHAIFSQSFIHKYNKFAFLIL